MRANSPALTSAILLCMSLALLVATPARAVPAFAVQTGQPCQACHVGGFGPQLTPFGRNFKIHGFTPRTTPFSIPFSAMAIASYLETAKDQTPPPAHAAANANAEIDQLSVFLAGGFGANFGAFVQATYDGVAKAFTWDNLDVRATTPIQVKDIDAVLGVSLNNSPTLTDPWNTLPAWGFPYTGSSLATTPGASPLFNGALAQTTLGVTGYAWIQNAIYLEAGAYGSPGASTLTHLGADPTSPGDLEGLAPYGRIAYQADVAGGTAHAGAFALDARLHPGLDRTSGRTDRFTDLGFDGSYQKTWDSGDVVSFNARYLHEQQALNASCILIAAGANCVRNELVDLRADASYYWRDKIGGTVQLFNTTGGANPFIFPDNRTSRPDSSGATLQLDGTPFGDAAQPSRRLNIRVGAQYTLYTRFNGSTNNFDRAGAKASDNNTFRLFTWLAF
jgi:hypothetical protein